MNTSTKAKKISRRKFIDLGVQGSAVIGLAQTFTMPLLMSSGCKSEGTKTVHGACYHDC